MSETLFPYYERELLFIRQLSQEFAKQYPAAAGRLLLEPNRSTDPHVERLIEAFALLAGRVHHKIDDEFPELTDALLGMLYPHYLAPVPSMATLQFLLDPARGQLPNGFTIDRNSKLHTYPVGGLMCRFRTCYPVTLWPVEVTSARFQPPPFPSGLKPPPRAAAALRIQLEPVGGIKMCEMSLNRLRLFLYGENQLIATLYETIFNNALQVVFRSLDKTGPQQATSIVAPDQCLFQVGFGRDEGILPYPAHSFPGYRLLTEFFAFPEKFLYLDLGGFDRVRAMNVDKGVEILIFLNRTLSSLEQGVDASTFRLGCTPVINLFEQTAEPVPLTQLRYEYPIVPDVAHPLGMEVYSIDEVSSTNPMAGTTTEYHPFYSFRHGAGRDTKRAFWYASRRPSFRGNDRGTDVWMNLVNLDFNPQLPADSVLIVRTTCLNRDLPNIMQRAGDDLYFELEAAAPLKKIRCLRSPTPTLRPPLRRGAHWRLVSHLALNHLSISDPVEGHQALQEILKLYDFSDPESGRQQAAVTRQIIEGITSVSSRPVVGRIGGPIASGFCRGTEVTIEFDEEKYIGTGVFLFASVLERFLGLYATINSFSQLIARTKQGEGYLKKWPPRAADLPLL
jgi:type VI secretion system protein ImpG